MSEYTVPTQLKQAQAELEALIRHEFKGTTREGGVSWSEAVVIDNYGSHEERVAARAKDLDQGWEEVLENPQWIVLTGIGGYSFLDPIGFRYYLAPALVRCIRSGDDEGIGRFLDIAKPGTEFRELGLEHVSLLSPSQCRAIVKFLRFMMSVELERAVEDVRMDYTSEWEPILNSHWLQFE